MTLKEIREECWDVARDTASIDQDRLWTTKEMNRYINRIYRKICKETECLVDSVSTFTQISIAGSNDTPAAIYIDLDPRILYIEEAKWALGGWFVREVSVAKWTNPLWETFSGPPTEFALDWSVNKLAFNFKPNITDTLKLRVRRMPLVNLVSDTDSPEFKVQYHDHFINGVLWQMYLKQDAESFDKSKAEEFKQLFLKDIDDMKKEVQSLTNHKLVDNSQLAFR